MFIQDSTVRIPEILPVLELLRLKRIRELSRIVGRLQWHMFRRSNLLKL